MARNPLSTTRKENDLFEKDVVKETENVVIKVNIIEKNLDTKIL